MVDLAVPASAADVLDGVERPGFPWVRCAEGVPAWLAAANGILLQELRYRRVEQVFGMMLPGNGSRTQVEPSSRVVNGL